MATAISAESAEHAWAESESSGEDSWTTLEDAEEQDFEDEDGATEYFDSGDEEWDHEDEEIESDGDDGAARDDASEVSAAVSPDMHRRATAGSISTAPESKSGSPSACNDVAEALKALEIGPARSPTHVGERRRSVLSQKRSERTLRQRAFSRTSAGYSHSRRNSDVRSSPPISPSESPTSLGSTRRASQPRARGRRKSSMRPASLSGTTSPPTAPPAWAWDGTGPDKLRMCTDDDDEVCIEGYLMKRGHFRRNWLKRWFELRSTMEDGMRCSLLMYYSDKGGELKKQIKLLSRTLVMSAPQKDSGTKSGYHFTLHSCSDGRSYALSAITPRSRTAWVQMIQRYTPS